MDILFPCDYNALTTPDPDFAIEVSAARAAGFVCHFFDFNALRAGDAYRLPKGEGALLYRGWMLSDTEYAGFYARLVARGWEPITPPNAYDEAHYLPLAYPKLLGETPRTEWITGRDEAEAWELYAAQFRAQDAILKDWVKSAKYRWREACFLPAGTERERFSEIFANFLSERSMLFEKGVVLREFHPFRVLHKDMRGMPLHEEYRLFFWEGELLLLPQVTLFPGPEEQLPRWTALARRFGTRFLSLDVARELSGDWWLVETGDGQVAGLPGSIAPEAFYGALRYCELCDGGRGVAGENL